MLLSLIMIILGAAVYRYRKGAGPAFMAVAGLSLGMYSVFDILEKTGVLELPMILGIALLVTGIATGLVSIALWRK